MTAKKCRLVIIGAGLAGLFLSITLRRAGHDVIVLEKAPVPQEFGAGINLPPNAVRALQQWGLLDLLLEKAHVVERATLKAFHGGQNIVDVDHTRDRCLWGVPYLVVHRVDLHQTLLRTAQAEQVQVLFGQKIESIVPNGDSYLTTVSANGTAIAANAVFGSDGERSWCRSLMNDHHWRLRDSGDHVYRLTIPLKDIAGDMEFRSLIHPFCTTCWAGQDSHAVTYVIKRDQLLNVVIQKTHAAVTDPNTVPSPAEKEKIASELAGWDPALLKIIDLATSCSCWPLLEGPALHKWVAAEANLALVGDAAHPLLPWLAQGAAMAFEDCAVLGCLLSNVQSQDEVRGKLLAYENIRKPRLLRVRQRISAMREMYSTLNRDDLKRNELSSPEQHAWLYAYDARAAVDSYFTLKTLTASDGSQVKNE